MSGLTPGLALARAAMALIGTPFRLHGRDPATGLDCVGLVHAALAAIGREAPAPCDYGLRNRDISRPLGFLSKAGLAQTSAPPLPGDVLLVEPGPLQHHLLILGEDGAVIHAHAGLRRVVSTPWPSTEPAPWPVLHRWRMIPSA
ncbi:C40 family peptidase [Altererythrobacter sp. CC-YST694]|uniref:NlpC/P60 family protein n=1 Tax=Altererythrobacter sp. CC-YST694 TaxID=2755038 RepID=UPI001D00F247|nr:NlpC/P60 family protein [Altererythrobacter sp. CC-YST694]MCB5425234.1 C40 family peptidase [Altererythrobacter sp. CC-YST694]